MDGPHIAAHSCSTRRNSGRRLVEASSHVHTPVLEHQAPRFSSRCCRPPLILHNAQHSPSLQGVGKHPLLASRGQNRSSCTPRPTQQESSERDCQQLSRSAAEDGVSCLHMEAAAEGEGGEAVHGMCAYKPPNPSHKTRQVIAHAATNILCCKTSPQQYLCAFIGVSGAGGML
jgi:hypothetical protein